MSDDFTHSFTTTLAPTKKFKIDGAEYDILGLDHLSSDDEAEVTALFARYGVLQSELESTVNTQKGTGLAHKIKSTRLNILAKLTTAPKDDLGKLHLTQQIALLDTLGALLEETEDEGSGASGNDD